MASESVLALVGASFRSIVRAWVDFLRIVVATVLVVLAEIFNTAIGALCDFIEQRHNEKIKVIRDIAAAAVGLTVLVWAIVLMADVDRAARLALS